ncbi:MAG TPA: OmpA family protein [Kofleriaceae bacterium]|jgi:outer membrane protein OmpA-like peptidoglycan-associated protein
MPRLAFGIRASTVASVLLAAGTASAQSAGSLTLDTFRPAMDSRGYITVNASQPLGHGEVSFGLGALDWGHHLLRFDGPAGASYSVDNVLTATLIGAVGAKLGPVELEFGASLPLTIMSGDRGPDDLGVASDPNDDMRFGLDGQGMGDLGLHLKTRFLSTSRGPGIGVGAIASVYLPTGTKDKFMGGGSVEPQLIGIVDKEFGRSRRLRISLNGGVRLRSTESFTDVGAGGAPATNGRITASSEIPFGLGIAYAISPQKFDIVGEVYGAKPIGDHENYQPAEAIGGVKLYLARNSFLSLGAGRGLATSKGANPDVRAFIGIVFEPSIGDRDGDGLKDDIDKCPDDPEDRDGFEDEDGCPDPDNDRDGILDEDDKCPLIPEDKDGFQDEDGCPEGEKNDRDGDSILDQVDKCPDDPEDFDKFEDEDGCPDLDNDKDGILDVDDLCPNDPEDKDGFEDEDGCPDLDNDKDGIPDKDDKCPNKPETFNKVEDEDGCPDMTIKVEDNKFVLQPIQFKLDSDVILPSSYYIVDEVVKALKDNPDLELMEVQGHTDEQGSDAHNLDLSDRRAASVKRYLVEHGIDENRLESQGYGETQPKDHHHNQRAYFINRRVDFLILKRAGQ